MRENKKSSLKHRGSSMLADQFPLVMSLSVAFLVMLASCFDKEEECENLKGGICCIAFDQLFSDCL